MTRLFGQDDAKAAFVAAMGSGSLHHAWLLAGPQGVGKGTFARQAALRLLEQQYPAGFARYAQFTRTVREEEGADGGDASATGPSREALKAASS